MHHQVLKDAQAAEFLPCSNNKSTWSILNLKINSIKIEIDIVLKKVNNQKIIFDLFHGLYWKSAIISAKKSDIKMPKNKLNFYVFF